MEEGKAFFFTDFGAKAMLTIESMGLAHREASCRTAGLRAKEENKIGSLLVWESTLKCRALVWYDHLKLLKININLKKKKQSFKK